MVLDSSLARIDVTTLPDLLRVAAETTPDQGVVHITADHEAAISYATLYMDAQHVADMLRRSGLTKGQILLISVESSQDFLVSFWGALIAGIVPAPLAAEPDRIISIVVNLEQSALLTNIAISQQIVAFAAQHDLPNPLIMKHQQLLDGPWISGSLQIFTTISDASVAIPPPASVKVEQHKPIDDQPQPHDLAYLQFSSGSTSNPRGIELSHAALLANLRQMQAACGIDVRDSSVSWMPYYHDMGLIAAHLLPLAARIKQIKIDELYFARRPITWLETTDRYRATLLTAAPFALELVNRRVKSQQITRFDLTCVRMLVVGAEPIVPSICRDFLKHLAPTGLSPQALLPVYGLAEACVGVTLSPLGTGMTTHLVDYQTMVRDQQAMIPPQVPQPNQHGVGDDRLLEIVDVGFPLPGCQVRIVDNHDRLLDNGFIGQVQVTGPQLMLGYHHSNDSQAAITNGWLRTGDLGFLHNGRLVITGRVKEVVIVNGRKHHAPDLEDRIRQIKGLQISRLVVCGTLHNSGEEQVLVFIALRRANHVNTPYPWHHALPAITQVVRCLQRVTGTTAIKVVPIPARQFPRTTSGKLRRTHLRARYEAGEFDSIIAAVQAALLELPTVTSNIATDSLEQELIQLCAQALKIDPKLVGINDSVFDLGATSLQLMDLLAAIGDQFKFAPNPTTLREYSTPASLARWLRMYSLAQSNPQTNHQTINPSIMPTDDPIAIIGMACRLPDAETPEQFWENLIAGLDSVRPLPRMRDNAIPNPVSNSSAWGSWVKHVTAFDAGFFNIDPKEAAVIDPQQRILLELAYQALERAGYAGKRRSGRRVGVFIGVGEAGYQQLLLSTIGSDQPIHPATATGNMRNLIAGRIAHSLDLNGPAIAIDTACSSTLVALHMARISLLFGDCDLALVGGINLNLTETPYQLLASAGALSPSGRCRAFDAAADGIVLGEGAGVLVVERMSTAQHNGDQIMALIRGSAINNDGHALSPMAPNPIRQAEVIAQAYHEAGLDPTSVSYIEAHGTGTAIGDPTEARSLAQVFHSAINAEPRHIGSVKTNIGHLLNAAGIPSLIKVILMLQHRAIPPSLHYTTPNQRFSLAHAGMTINTSTQPWRGPHPLRAGVNSFGFGGTNAHIILEEPPAVIPAAETPNPNAIYLLGISAHTSQALRELAGALAKQLRTDQTIDLADVCFSSAERAVFAHRAVLITQRSAAISMPDISNALESLAAGNPSTTVVVAPTTIHKRKVALLFAGQGAQYPQQGFRLYQEHSIFRTTLDAASHQLGLINGRTLLEWCFGLDIDSASLADTVVTQPLLVAFEVALARLVMSWGLSPDAVIGHSVGELAAACIVGILKFEDALVLARTRGQLMATLAEPGMMAAVFAPEAVVLAVLAPMAEDLTIAAFNTPNQVVIAGHKHAVQQAVEILAFDGYTAITINQHMAYHSPLMEAAVQPIASAASMLQSNTGNIPFFSTVSLNWIQGAATLDADYWASHAIQPVRFAPAIEQLISEGFNTFVEIGPGSTLTAFARQIIGARDCQTEALLRRGTDDCTTIRTALGHLWVQGIDLDLQAIMDEQAGRRVLIPTYPFARDHHWLSIPQAPISINKQLTFRPSSNMPTALQGQPITAVTLQPTPNGYHLRLAASDGRTLFEIANLQAEPSNTPTLSDQSLLHQIVWNHIELPKPAITPINHWIILADQHNQLADSLAKALQMDGQQCLVISSEDVEMVRQAIWNQQYGIVFLADCGPDCPIEHVSDLDHAMRTGVLRLLSTIQAILAWPVTFHPAGLWIVTAGAYAVGTGSNVVADRAMIAGLAAAIPDNNPQFSCVAIDLALGMHNQEQTNILIHELGSQPSTGVFAWRDGQRLTRAWRLFSPNDLMPVCRNDPPNRLIIIAGGAGGIGAYIARHLATHNHPRLILLGRAPLDRSRSELLADLARLGAQADYYQIDITDEQQVEQLISRFSTVADGIFGIVQAAGIIDVGSLQTKQAEQFAAVLAPKVKGTWLLTRALLRHSQQPTFFITCSSIAAVIPGLSGGIADYAVANAFLDAFAASEQRVGRPMVAINWSAWDGVGLASIPMLLNRIRQRSLPPLKPTQALQAFDQALTMSQHQSQLMVLLAHHSVAAENAYPIDQTVQANHTSPPHTINLAQSIAQQIQQLVGKTLRIDPKTIAYDAAFLSLGLDSLQAVDLVKQLEQSMGMVLPLTLFFEFQSIQTLAEHLSTIAIQPQQDSLINSVTAIENQTNQKDQLEEVFELAPSQIGFYVGQRLYPESPAFAFVRQHILGPLDPIALQHALMYLVTRHPMLRTQFVPGDQTQTEPRQQIVPSTQLPVHLWFEQLEALDDQSTLEDMIIHHQFDLHSAPLFRVILYRCTDNTWMVYLLLHHSIADGWSMSILLEELWQVYTKQIQGIPIDLLPPECTFKDYVTQTLLASTSRKAATDQAWWMEIFKQRRDALAWSLPNNGSAPELGANTIRSLQQHYDRATSKRLQQYAAQLGVSLFHLLLATYARQLANWTQTNALTINVAEHGRHIHLPGVERMIGCCAEHVPLLIQRMGSESSSELAIIVRDEWAAIQQHRQISAGTLSQLYRTQRPNRTTGSAAFSLARFHGTLPKDCPIEIHDLVARTATASTQLSLLIWEFDGMLQATWTYATTAFQHQTIAQLANNYQQELNAIAQLIYESPVQESAQVLGDPQIPTIEGLLVPTRILNQCRYRPEGIAVIAGGNSLTYGELADRASQVAHWLIAHRTASTQTVALLTQPSLASIVGMVGALWAGVPWVGLNTDYPFRQLQAQIQQAGVQLLLYHDDTQQLAAQLQSSIYDQSQAYCLDQALQQTPLVNRPDLPVETLNPDQLAYILFTSGSTGQPKGVPITHRALANYIQWLTETFHYNPNDRLLLTAALSFDAAISQILGPLTTGGSIIMLSPMIIRDPEALLAVVEQQRPTIWRSVPLLWERLLSAIEHRIKTGQIPPPLSEIRVIGIGGEALPASYIRRWMDIYGERHHIVNHYGPTEATINALYHRVTHRPTDTQLQIPIGQPIQGVIARILDAQGNSCKPMTIGELFLGGVALSPGYLGQPDLTALQFVPDPLRSGERLYRTGDLVQAQPDGNFVFMGRVDHQIIVRGYRIEPTEIEAALIQHASIVSSVVCLAEDPGNLPILVAYLEVAEELPATTKLRRWLAGLLPPHMLPQRFYVLPKLPTTSTGKLDRAQLRLLPASELTPLAHGKQPETSTERLVAEIWQGVLKLSVIHQDDDFFELGGDSLLLLQVLTRLESQMPNLPRAAIFYQQRTLAAWAKVLDTARSSPYNSMQDTRHPISDQTELNFALTPAQMGFLLAETINPAAATTWCASLVVNGQLDLPSLQQAFETLINRHLMLRVRILINERPPSQQELAFTPLLIDFDDLSEEVIAHANEPDLIMNYWRTAKSRHFKLDQTPLLRMHVLRLTPTRHVWLIAGHHIIGDGWSTWIFGQELLQLYDGFVSGNPVLLPPLRSTFKDYVNKIQHNINLVTIHERYWKQIFAQPYQPPILKCKVKPSTSDGFGLASRRLDATTVASLRRVSANAGITPYLLFFSVFVRQLHYLSGAHDLVVGTAHAGRDLALPDIERLFGCFATALPIRIQHQSMEVWASASNLLQPVAQAFREAYLHALAPSEIARIIDASTGKTLAQPTSISTITAIGAQFFFTFLDFDALGSLQSETLSIDWETSDTDIQPPSGATEILFAVRLVDNTIRLTLQAATNKLAMGTLQTFMDNLVADIHMLTTTPVGLHTIDSSHPIRFIHEPSLPPISLDAALIGYLPPSQSLATALGLHGDAAVVRERLRSILFPNNQPRWFEVLQTSIGSSALLCLPWFAEELHSANIAQLETAIVAGILHAQTRGARCVSLAGMLPSLTGYGFGVLRSLETANQARPALTTGHATTTVAVIQTLKAALYATNRVLEQSDLAFVGLGSIGQTALRLLLTTLPHPRSLVLCDTANQLSRLNALAQTLRTDVGYQGTISIVAADKNVPTVVYQTQIIIAATSTAGVIDVERLQAGTIVVDDSFPACLDPAAAIHRMQHQGDVLIVGGGLLACGPSQRTIELPIHNPALCEQIMAHLIPHTAASCQLEALIWANDPSLPLTHGLVTIENALRYQAAVVQAGFGPAPLHLQSFQPDSTMFAQWSTADDQEQAV